MMQGRRLNDNRTPESAHNLTPTPSHPTPPTLARLRQHTRNTMYLTLGTRNDESAWLAGPGYNPGAAGPLDNRLTVHTIRDTTGQVLGLGSSSRVSGGVDVGGVGDDDEDDSAAAGGWEPAVEACAAHDVAVTGIDVAGGFGNLGGVSAVVTSGGDG